MAQKANNELAHFRNYFYRDGFRKITFVLMFSLILNVCLAIIAGYLFVFKPAPQYFATSTNGGLFKMIPTSEPTVKSEQVLSFASQAAIKTTSFDWLNYQQSLSFAQKYFTAAGSQAFENALQTSGTIKTVTDSRFSATGYITGIPTIVKKGLIGSTYTWRVSIPMTIQYENPSRTSNQQVVVDMLVTRVSTDTNYQGILIEQYSLAPRKSGPPNA